MIAANTELFGRKTFFMAADSSLIPNEGLEDFMSQGFQAYIIADDGACPLEKKVRQIAGLYPDAILYFNVDAKVPGLNWLSYLKEIQTSLGGGILLGIVFNSRKTSSEDESLKSQYLGSLRLGAGVFALSPDKPESFKELLSVLEKNGARGRRNLVRAQCDKSSLAKFNFNGQALTAELIDINSSYFRCDLSQYTNSFSAFEKVRDVELSVNGINFVSDAVLIMRRTTEDKTLCIFMFIKRNDTPDLDAESARLLNQKIYQISRDENLARLSEVFSQAE
ncbi:MAG: hypothetical protein K5873_04240 [Treponema sp.]|nr:hypothetical protein [Treponema sp.]